MMITPSSTVVSKLIEIKAFERNAEGIRNADRRYLTAVGVPDRPLALWEFVADAADGDGGAARLFGKETQLYNTVAMTASAFEARAGGLPFAFLADVAIEDIAHKIASPDASLDLTREPVVANILRGISVRTGVTFSDAEIASLSAAIAHANRLIEQIALAGSRSYLDAVVKVQQVAQGEFSATLAQFARGHLTAAQLQTTTGKLSQAVAATRAFNVLPVYLGAFSATVAEGDGGDTYLEFTVVPYGDPALPVSVEYRTVAGTAAEGSDYEASAGTLTWAAGDTSPQIVRVRVLGDTTPEAG
ncbi:MAG: hypothetical protein KY476_11235, partial [Planctomycetes bacterium]|nr:hypothetical protein [Planctomycetota bacterium]